MKNKNTSFETSALLRLFVLTLAAAAVRYAVCVPQIMQVFGK